MRHVLYVQCNTCLVACRHWCSEQRLVDKTWQCATLIMRYLIAPWLVHRNPILDSIRHVLKAAMDAVHCTCHLLFVQCAFNSDPSLIGAVRDEGRGLLHQSLVAYIRWVTCCCRTREVCVCCPVQWRHASLRSFVRQWKSKIIVNVVVADWRSWHSYPPHKAVK
jgi:hypothetical protein